MIEFASQQHSRNIQNYPQTNKTAQQQDFSKIFYQFTHKIDLSSSKIIDFYDNFLIQKLELAEQHIEQISKLSMLQKPRKRVENPTNKQIDQENQKQRKSQQLKKMKVHQVDMKSQKKIFDDKFMNDLSKDLLQLDLDFMDDNNNSLQSSQKIRESQGQSQSSVVSQQISSQGSNNQPVFSVKINGKDMRESVMKPKKIINGNQNFYTQILENYEDVNTLNNNDIYKTQVGRKSYKDQQMVNENSQKKSNTLEVGNANGKQFRKSLIEQFSEMKVKGKEEIKNEKQNIQEQIEQINIEDFYQSTINPSFFQMQPERSNQSDGINESNQESLLLPGKSSTSSSDVPLQLNFNDNDEYHQGNSMQPQQLPEGFYIHGNNHILLEEEEDDNEYEMTDYSSNESSNMGSPVFNWVSKEEQMNDKILFNNDLQSSSQYNNNNVFNIPSNKYNNKNQNIFDANSSQQSDSNENSKTFNNPLANSDYFSQNTFGFGYNQPLFLDENSNSSQDNFKKLALYSQDSFSGMNFQNNTSKQDILSSQSGNQNLFMSMNNDSNSANPYIQLNKKLLYSPQKLKTVKQRKILYCNNKEVPSWAQDLTKVTQKVREQKARGEDPIKFFGLFAVESLQLREVFKNTGKRYDEGRGSSANWRQDYTPDQMIENLINATSQTPNKKQKMQSKFKSFLQNSFNSIKKKLIQ